MTTGLALAEEVAARTGLAQIIAAGVIRRACVRAGLKPEQLTQHDLPQLVEAMAPLLAVYLGADAEERVGELRRFAEAG